MDDSKDNYKPIVYVITWVKVSNTRCKKMAKLLNKVKDENFNFSR